jgi:two-component system sensor histidine kinase/response regulator
MIIQSIPDRESWNKAETLERLGGDEELLQELVQIFVDESPKLLQRLRDAVSGSDPEAVMRGAHSIKGELSCLGGGAAAKAALELEMMGRNKELSGAAQTLGRLEQELTAFKLLLRDSVTVHS